MIQLRKLLHSAQCPTQVSSNYRGYFCLRGYNIKETYTELLVHWSVLSSDTD